MACTTAIEKSLAELGCSNDFHESALVYPETSSWTTTLGALCDRCAAPHLGIYKQSLEHNLSVRLSGGLSLEQLAPEPRAKAAAELPELPAAEREPPPPPNNFELPSAKRLSVVLSLWYSRVAKDAGSAGHPGHPAADGRKFGYRQVWLLTESDHKSCACAGRWHAGGESSFSGTHHRNCYASLQNRSEVGCVSHSRRFYAGQSQTCTFLSCSSRETVAKDSRALLAVACKNSADLCDDKLQLLKDYPELQATAADAPYAPTRLLLK